MKQRTDFYPRPPRGGRPYLFPRHFLYQCISIHALREEGDARCCRARSFLAGFLSTPSARRATCTSGRSYPDSAISIHALREEGDNCSSLAAAMTGRISIHALREEGDRWLYRMFHRYLISIHALREEGDMAVRAGCCCSTYFYPRPPRGGRLQRARQRPARFFISIHALREEGDLLDRWEEYSLETFLSTPSARRATRSLALAFRSPRNFYPRPPRGGRQAAAFVLALDKLFLSTPSARRATTSFHFCVTLVLISIHALREEGDCPLNGPASPASRFLSTPSARRATR